MNERKQQEMNSRNAKTRTPVEPVLGSLEREQGGICVRAIGQVRAAVKMGPMNLAHNMSRMASLLTV